MSFLRKKVKQSMGWKQVLKPIFHVVHVFFVCVLFLKEQFHPVSVAKYNCIDSYLPVFPFTALNYKILEQVKV